MAESRNSVTLADFGTGMLVGFVAVGAQRVHVARLDQALVNAYEYLSEAGGGKMLFHVSMNELHGDAPEARRAVGGAVSRGLAHFEDEVLTVDVSREYASRYFSSLPLTEELWRAAALVALSHVRGETNG